MRRRSDFRQRQDAAIGRPDVCECCCNGIDGLDAGARHLCGNCSMKDLARPYDTMEKQCSRIHELEDTMSAMLDVARDTELHLPDEVKVTMLAVPTSYVLNHEDDAEMTVTVTYTSCKLDSATRQQFVQGMADEVERVGDWSTMRNQERTIERLHEKIRELNRQKARLIKWIDKTVTADAKNAEFKAACSTRRLGGTDAMKQLLTLSGAIGL